MHALFSTHPAVGHANPMIPLALALREAGHRVTFATSPSFCDYPARFGFDAVGVGLDWLESTAEERFAEVLGAPEEWDGDTPWRNVFMTASQAVLHDLLRLVAERSVDVVVHETTESAAVFAAELAGVPAVAVGIGYQAPTLVGDHQLREAWGTARAALGLPPDPDGTRLFRDLYLDLHPRSLHAQPAEWAIPSARPVRPEVLDPLTPPPPWLATLEERTVAYVTLGTVFNRSRGLFDRVLAALDAQTDLTVVATTGGAPVDAASTSRAIVEPFVPDAHLLPAADIVVCHAGYNTTVAALAHGLPLVCIPIGADQHFNAFRVASAGAGIALDAQADTATIAEAVATVRSDPLYRMNARRLAREIAAMPPVRSLVPSIEALVATAPSPARVRSTDGAIA